MTLSLDTEHDFDALFEALAADIIDANTLNHIRKKLSETYLDHETEYNAAATFWSLMFNALYDALVLSLCRVYDHESSSVSLAKLLDLISLNVEVYKKGREDNKLGGNCYVDQMMEQGRRPNLKQMEKQKELCKANNPRVHRLILARNNIVVHRGVKVSLGRSQFIDANPLSQDDIDALLKQATRILNQYFKKFSETTFEPLMGGHDDVEVFLSSFRHAAPREKDT